jgi:hypothetical protein
MIILVNGRGAPIPFRGVYMCETGRSRTCTPMTKDRSPMSISATMRAAADFPQRHAAAVVAMGEAVFHDPALVAMFGAP